MTTPDALFASPDAQQQADSIARRILRRLPRDRVLLGELRCAALEGLWQAARTFDPERGLAFNTHARHRIRGAVLDWLRVCDHSPRRYRREGKRQPEQVSLDTDDTLHPHPCDDTTTPEEHCCAADLAEVVTRHLSWRERFLLNRFYTDGWSQHRIAEALGLVPRDVTLLHQALLAKLRGRLAQRGLLEESGVGA